MSPNFKTLITHATGFTKLALERIFMREYDYVERTAESHYLLEVMKDYVERTAEPLVASSNAGLC